MNNPTVCLGCPTTDVCLFVQHTKFSLITGQLSCNSRSAYSCSDYDHIIHLTTSHTTQKSLTNNTSFDALSARLSSLWLFYSVIITIYLFFWYWQVLYSVSLKIRYIWYPFLSNRILFPNFTILPLIHSMQHFSFNSSGSTYSCVFPSFCINT